MQLIKNNIVFIIALLIVLFFVVIGIISPDRLSALATSLQEGIINTFGWGYLLAAFLFIVFNLYLALSKYGEIKLGKDGEKPQ